MQLECIYIYIPTASPYIELQEAYSKQHLVPGAQHKTHYKCTNVNSKSMKCYNNDSPGSQYLVPGTFTVQVRTGRPWMLLW